jgi:hypothetical protein
MNDEILARAQGLRHKLNVAYQCQYWCIITDYSNEIRLYYQI